MIHQIPLLNSLEIDDDLKQIYFDSFPPEERRDWPQLIELLNNPLYNLLQIYSLNQFVGFISIWKLSGFYFIEHFAIRESERKKGHGIEVIRQLIQQKLVPVVIEVEEPFSDEACRRIRFYESLNFKINQNTYFQPPYSIGKKAVKMHLMSYPDEIQQKDFENTKTQIYQWIYPNLS